MLPLEGDGRAEAVGPRAVEQGHGGGVALQLLEQPSADVLAHQRAVGGGGEHPAIALPGAWWIGRRRGQRGIDGRRVHRIVRLFQGKGMCRGSGAMSRRVDPDRVETVVRRAVNEHHRALGPGAIVVAETGTGEAPALAAIRRIECAAHVAVVRAVHDQEAVGDRAVHPERRAGHPREVRRRDLHDAANAEAAFHRPARVSGGQNRDGIPAARMPDDADPSEVESAV